MTYGAHAKKRNEPWSFPQWMVTESCCNCGVAFAIPTELQRVLIRDGSTFHCPLGHPQSYTDTSAKQIKRLRELVAKERRATDRERAEVERKERSNRALRGHITRKKKRAAAGVCPCCNRTFQQLAAHMKTQHPKCAEPAVKVVK